MKIKLASQTNLEDKDVLFFIFVDNSIAEEGLIFITCDGIEFSVLVGRLRKVLHLLIILSESGL